MLNLLPLANKVRNGVYVSQHKVDWSGSNKVWAKLLHPFLTNCRKKNNKTTLYACSVASVDKTIFVLFDILVTILPLFCRSLPVLGVIQSTHTRGQMLAGQSTVPCHIWSVFPILVQHEWPPYWHSQCHCTGSCFTSFCCFCFHFSFIYPDQWKSTVGRKEPHNIF